MSLKRFNNLINSKDFVILDGAMGTLIQEKGLEPGKNPCLVQVENPEWLYDIHSSYLNAGSDIICANTFGVLPHNIENLQLGQKSLEDLTFTLIKSAIAPAKAAINDAIANGIKTDALVALDIAPSGKLMEPSGDYTFEEAYQAYKTNVLAAVEGGADLIFIETMTDLREAKAAILAAKENSNLPVIASLTFEENGRTFLGTNVASMAVTLEGLGVDGLGVNCSLGPDKLYPVFQELVKWTKLPILAKPNAGLPDPLTGKYDCDPEKFGPLMAEIGKLGVKLLGGCCGTTPEHIKSLVSQIKDIDYKKADSFEGSVIASSSQVLVVDSPKIIGERINPTGKKLFKEALTKGDYGYTAKEATRQVKEGAHLLDINVGMAGIDEEETMFQVLKEVTSAVSVPVVIDSSSPIVLEKALRFYDGKPLVNSVNGGEDSLNAVLPLVKKYGASVIGLTLDDDGIPETWEGRFEIAKRIVDKAAEFGIEPKDIYIDCLTLTVATNQNSVKETLTALKQCKEKLGVRTTLGVSNISFGLPDRDVVNGSFLTLALNAGLDLPIINPGSKAMKDSYYSYLLLSGVDKGAAQYTALYGNKEKAKDEEIIKSETDSDSSNKGENWENKLYVSIIEGLAEDAKSASLKLAETKSTMEIIETIIIPALDKIGDEYDKGDIFLPQMIFSAEAAQGAVDAIKMDSVTDNKGTIVLATVKGDIHDIGKNIVKMVLSNYGYNIIDLGYDVDKEKVLEAVIEHNAQMVGLSALMTTTLPSMKETIELIKEKTPHVKTIIGGAVVTKEYADSIGADGYGKDAKESAELCKVLLG